MAKSAKPKTAASKPTSGLETAPTCDKLLGKQRKIPGAYPGAAYNELRNARKALVRGDLDEAQRCYCRSVRYDSGLVDSVIGLARLLLIRRDAQAAAEWARKAAGLAPGNDDAQGVLGDALALAGDELAARTALLASAGVRPEDEPSTRTLARRNVQLGHASMRRLDHANAERYFRRAHVLEPGSWEGPYGVARALLDVGKADLATGWARLASELAKDMARTHVLLGDALSASGKSKEAEVAWRKALELDPNDPEARFRIGRLASAN